MVERVRNRTLTDSTVGDSFATMTRDELLKRLADADIAFAEVNTMADLARASASAAHRGRRRPHGPVSYPAPAAIFVGEPRHYGAVPAIGEHPSETAKRSHKPAQRQEPASRHDRASPEAIDLDHLRQWIGRTERSHRHRHRATGGGIARDVVSRHRRAEEGDAAPFTAHWCLAPPVVPMSELGPDGHPSRGGFLPPVPLPRRMWAGGELEFVEPLRVGDEVTRASTIKDVTLKTGSTGTLCFVSVDH